MIGYTGMIPTPKSKYVPRSTVQTFEGPQISNTDMFVRSSWSPDQCDIETLRKEDPGLAIASSIPVARLGTPDEVANVVLL